MKTEPINKNTGSLFNVKMLLVVVVAGRKAMETIADIREDSMKRMARKEIKCDESECRAYLASLAILREAAFACFNQKMPVEAIILLMHARRYITNHDRIAK